VNSAQRFRWLRDGSRRSRRGDGDGSLVADGGRPEPRVEEETILETIRDGVIVVHDDAAVDYVNGAAERLLGIDRERLVGESLAALDRDGVFPGVDCSSLQRAVDAVGSGAFPAEEHSHVEEELEELY
jgi:PAS domain-containing protein